MLAPVSLRLGSSHFAEKNFRAICGEGHVTFVAASRSEFKMADAFDFFILADIGELEKDLLRLQAVVERIFVLFDLVSYKFSGR